MQPNYHRALDQSGEPDERDADPEAFEPGVSFANEPSDDAGSGELPPWLQDFAGAAGEPQGTATAGAGAAPAEAQERPPHASMAEPSRPPSVPAQPPSAVLQSQAAAEPAAQFGQVPGSDGTNFLSEDDLPEWLRALSTENPPAAGAAPVAAVETRNPVTPNEAIQVPPVSRAWVTASDQAEVSSGANLLSSLVHAIDSRPDAVAVESSVSASASPAGARSAARQQTVAPAASGPVNSTTAPASDSVPRDGGRWSRTRILAIAVIIVLLVLVYFMLSGS